MTIEKKTEHKAIKRYKSACESGVCPTIEEIGNSKIRELAERLSGSSEKETLTNISEWHNNNMTFWFERYPLIYYTIVTFAVTIAFVALTSSFSLAWSLFTISGTVTATLFVVTVFMVTYYRKIPLSEFYHIIEFSISMDFLINRKLAVCRDYAKLSVAILFNIYPEKEIFFVYAPLHVSTGIMIGNKLYILDKYLPVTTFLKWNEKWNKGKYYRKKVERAKGGLMSFVKDPDGILPKTNQSELDWKKLSSKLEQIIGIQNSGDYSRDSSVQIWKWKKGAKLCEDDEIVNYSIARRMEAIISREKLNKKQITRIEIKRNNDDLIFLAYLK